MTNETLISKAVSVIKSKKVDGHTIGDVGCALVSDKNGLYLGVCIDTSSGMGYCAEHTAIGAMITAGEYTIKKIVAVWKDKRGNVFVLSPCGRCREFVKRINKKNLETEIVLGKDKTAKLKDLLPYHDWWEKM